MDDDVPRDGDAAPRATDPRPDLRLTSDGGAGWSVDIPGETGEVSAQDVEAPTPPPVWFAPPDTDA